MSGFTFRKATRKQGRLRLGLIGPAGSGKSYTMLKVAGTLCSRFVAVDSEHGSLEKYAGEFEFDVINGFDEFDPRALIEAIHAAEAAGYDGIGIDSLSAFWTGAGGALEQVDRITARSRAGNSFSAGWREMSPVHNRLIDTILGTRMHVIATLRVKTEYVMDEIKGPDGRTKKVPRKIGLAPVQRDGLEYEFDVVGDMEYVEEADANELRISKTRCSDLRGKVIRSPGDDFALTLKRWLDDGEPDHRALAAAELERWSGVPRSERDDFRAAFRRVCEAHGIDAEDPDYKRVREVIRAAEAEGLTFAAVTVQDKPKAEPATEPAPKAKPSGKAKAAPVLIPDADAADDIDTPF